MPSVTFRITVSSKLRWDTESTICAIATGDVGSVRGAIRMTGPRTIAILQSVLSCQDWFDPLDARARRIQVSLDLGTPLGQIPVDLWLWPTNRSYTGSPSAELHMIGNQPLLSRTLQRLCEHGARIAEPGEFTLRAFLAGRMDLTQCEAVLGAIQATNDQQFEVALRQLAGGLSKPLSTLRTGLIELLADIEAGLDFVDEDISFISRDNLLSRLDESVVAIQALENQLSQRDSSQSHLEVVLTGLPNAGKSSLMNAMADRSIAIVNQQAGTTRDYIRVRLEQGGRAVDLIDTAGVESLGTNLITALELDAQAESDTDRESRERSLEQRETARLILYCIDSNLSEGIKHHEITQLKLLSAAQKETWLVWTKCEAEKPMTFATEIKQLDTSSHSLKGLQELRDAIFQWHDRRSDEPSMIVPTTAVRCITSLHAAGHSLQHALQAAHQQSDELVSSELRIALEAIGTVVGEVYTDDILDVLFSRFCIGK